MAETPFERVTVVREFPVALSEDGDGRTVEVRIVPYNTPTEVSDPPDFTPYIESWLPGCFERQTNAAGRVKVLMNFEHRQGLRDVVGHGKALRDREDALYGTFRIHNTPDGDKALELIHEEILDGISLEALVTRSRRTEAGVERVRATLDKVALCRQGAYPQAQVLAVRQEEPVDDEDEPEPEPVPEDEPERSPIVVVSALSDEVTARMAALGYESISRAVTSQAWDASASRFSDEEYLRSCLVCRPGDEPPKVRGSLPVLEPNGELNVNGMRAAADRISRTGLPGDLKSQAARKLIRYYRQVGETPPASLRNLAAR